MLVPCRGFCFLNQFLSEETENIKHECSSPVGGFIFLIYCLTLYLHLITSYFTCSSPVGGFIFLIEYVEEDMSNDWVGIECSSPLGGVIFLMALLEGRYYFDAFGARPLSGILFF